MHGVAYAAALVLAAVFARAGVAKLGDAPGTRTTFAALGLPAGAAMAVPLVELVLAVSLVLFPGYAAVVALAVLAGFTTFLVRGIRAGVTVGCNCFGSAGHAPISRVDVIRNALLAGTAAVALWATSPTVPRLGACAVTLVGLGVAMTVLRVVRRAPVPPEGPALGAMAVPVPGRAWSAGITLVAFHAPGCPRCERERPLLDELDADVAVVRLGPDTRPLFDAYRVRATPFYVLVDADGSVRWRGDVVPPDARADQRAR